MGDMDEEGLKKKKGRKFPGSPVVRTQCFHHQAWVSIPGWGTKIAYLPRGAAKKIKTNLSKKKTLYLKSNQSICKLKPVTNHSI